MKKQHFRDGEQGLRRAALALYEIRVRLDRAWAIDDAVRVDYHINEAQLLLADLERRLEKAEKNE